MNTIDAHAHHRSTFHARSHTATEHVISWWRARLWRNSIDCQHVIEVLLSLRANQTCQASQLKEVLAQNLPPLFTPNPEDAFFAVLEQQIISDVNLREAIVNFLAGWRGMREASYRELLTDPAVAQKANALLPKDVPLWRWIKSRMRGEMWLTEEEFGGWTVHLLRGSPLLKEVASWYATQTQTEQTKAAQR